MKRLETLKKLDITDTEPVVEFVNGEPAVELYWDADGVEYRFALPWAETSQDWEWTPIRKF